MITEASKWPKWQEVSEIFMVLANTETLSNLEHWQKEKLVADWRKTHVTIEQFEPADKQRKQERWRRNVEFVSTLQKETAARLKRALKNKAFRDSWKGTEIPYEWLSFFEIHPWARRLINALVDGGKADVRDFQKKMLLPIEVQQDGELTAVLYDPGALTLDETFFDLWKVITLWPFPFRRCPTCKKIFVKVSKRQKYYCDKRCANKAIGSRKEYMRDYMRERRRLESGAGGKQKRA